MYKGQKPKLEPNLKIISNTITTVVKDNYVLEITNDKPTKTERI